MHKAIPAVLVTAAAFVVVWRFEPTPSVTATAVPAASAGSLTVDGSAESTRWGTVQVRAVFSGGQLSDVQVIQAPNDGPTNRALPELRADALSTHSADVDTVTGATMTSEAYAKSLQSAIDARDK